MAANETFSTDPVFSENETKKPILIKILQKDKGKEKSEGNYPITLTTPTFPSTSI
jgi:hypothetical protein